MTMCMFMVYILLTQVEKNSNIGHERNVKEGKRNLQKSHLQMLVLHNFCSFFVIFDTCKEDLGTMLFLGSNTKIEVMS